MNDEEKKAIEYLKRHIIPYYGRKGTIEFMLNDIVLNLIEKQSKEIEELKEKTKKCEYYEMVADELYKNSVSKDKIKAKIEEIDIEIQCCEYADDDIEEYKQDMEKEKSRLLRDKKVLQSLLEKE